ncbi:MAG: TonB-dependent receptor [Rhodospirillales bacterium]|nr:TonB-dependent receptor [Rhodospirillales bacterium]
MLRSSQTVGLAAVFFAAMSLDATAETFTLDPVVVEGSSVHRSQQLMRDVEKGMNANRTNSYLGGAVLQNLNPVNSGDAFRYNVPGIINQPGSGDRFGGSTKIRTFGDFGAASSIDGAPALRIQGQEGGGYTNTLVPTIAIDRMAVMKGSRGVSYGDGTDGGVIDTRIKSGRNYDNHQAVSFDASTAREALFQAEAGHHTGEWDYYVAGSGLYGAYSGNPDNLEQQVVLGGLVKAGYNFNEDTRLEVLGIYDRSDPRIYRNDAVNDIDTRTIYTATTLDSRLSDDNSVRLGYVYETGSSRWPDRNRDRGITNNILYAEHFLRADVHEGVRYDGSLGAQMMHVNTKRDKQWDNEFEDYAVYTENAFSFGDDLVVNGGLRYTWFQNDIVLDGVGQAGNLDKDGLLSYEGGAAYNVLAQSKLRVSYATGFNRFFSKYGNFGTDALNEAGDGDRIVEARTMEVGFNQGWTGGYFDIALYNTVQENVPRRNNSAIESVEVDQTGLEVEVFSNLTDNLTGSLGYMRVLDVSATRRDGTEVNHNIFWGSQVASVPENQVSLRLDYGLTDKINLWGTAFYSTGYTSVDASGSTTERKDFERIDLGASYAANEQLVLRARIENITDERGFGQEVTGSYTDTDGNLGRVFWLGLDYTL